MDKNLVVVTGFSATAEQSKWGDWEFPLNATVLAESNRVEFSNGSSILLEKLINFQYEQIVNPKYVLREKHLAWQGYDRELITQFPHRYKDSVWGHLMIDCNLRVIHVTDHEQTEFNDITDDFEIIIVNAD